MFCNVLEHVQFVWMAISECAAVRFNQVIDNDYRGSAPTSPMEHFEGPDALIVYGGGFTNTIRKLQFSRISYPEVWSKGSLCFERENPPDEETLRERWHAVEAMRNEENLKSALELQRATQQWQSRKPDESANDFYRRVAGFYLILQRNTGTPLVSLAEIAGVSKNTAAQWVKQARTRKYLPTTNSDKGSSHAGES